MKKRKGLIILMAGLLLPVCVNAATHMVTNTGDGGAGSLRAAVAASNAEGGMSQIRFDLPGSNPHIRLDSALTLTSSVTLDGSSVSGQLVLSAPASAHLFIFRPASANDSIVLRSFTVDSVAGTQILLDTIHALASASFRQLKMEFASPYSRIYPVDDKWKVRVDSCQFANCNGNESYAAVQADCHYVNVNGSSFTNCIYGVMNIPFASKYATSFLFSNSSFKNCSTGGICLYSARQNSVRKCTFDSCYYSFFVNYPMDKLSDIIVDSCIIRNATEYGIYSLLNGISITVSNNLIDHSGWASVFLTRDEYTDSSTPHYPSQIVLYKNQFKNSIKHINVYVGAEKTTVKDNVIVGSSVDWGLFDKGSDTLIVEGNRVGMDTSGAMVPNAKGGIEIRTKSSIMPSTNKLRSEYKVVRNNIFAGNGGNAIQIDSAKAQVIISNNQFIKTGALAISNAQKLSVPVISDLSVDGGYVRVSGKVDSLSMVELYLTDSLRQTARLFVDSVRTDAEGNFSFRVPRALMQQHALYCFAATATYHALNTSNLSDPVCCENCKLDLSHRDYYVKVSATGNGSGKDWENAMSSADFALALPAAPDSATFYVAAGRYLPVYDSTMAVPAKSMDLCYIINKNVTIVGGFPADAVTGAVSQPDSFKTVFDGDILNDDVIKDDSAASFNYAKADDNATNLFILRDSVSNVDFTGVQIQHAKIGIIVLGKGYAELNIKKSEFSFCYNYAILQPNNKPFILNLKHSVLTKNNGGLLITDLKSLTAKQVLFERNQLNSLTLITKASDDAYVNFDSVTVRNSYSPSSFVFNGTSASVNNSEFSNIEKCDVLFNNTNNEKNSVTDFKNCSFENCNAGYLMTISDKLTIRNSKIVNNKFSSIMIQGQHLLMDSCIVKNNNFANVYTTDVAFNNSLFEANKGLEVLNKHSIVQSCTFYKNDSSRLQVDSLYLSNSTIVGNFNNMGANGMLSFLVGKLYNNTVLGNKIAWPGVIHGMSGSHYLYGNIMLGNETSYTNKGKADHYLGLLEFYGIKDVSYNLTDLIRSAPCTELYDKTIWVPDNNTNLLVRPFDVPNSDVASEYECKACQYTLPQTEQSYLEFLFDGTYDTTTHVFTPALSYNGGFTPTVALKSDTLPDGTSIRFPLDSTMVTADQRGVARLNPTCMGAYEIHKSNKDTLIRIFNDSICAGSIYAGHGWTIDTKDSAAGTYTYDSLMVGSVYDTLRVLHLHIGKIYPQLTLKTATVKNETCYGKKNGQITLNVTNPANERLRIVSKGDSLYTEAKVDSVFRIKATPGMDTITICYDSLQMCQPKPIVGTYKVDSMKSPIGIDTAATLHQQTCFVPVNGEIVATVSGWADQHTAVLGNSPIRPDSVNGDTAHFDIKALPAGQYKINVHNECESDSADKTLTITGIAPLEVTVDSLSKMLQCSYSTNGYVAMSVRGGYADSTRFGLSLWKNQLNRPTYSLADTTHMVYRELPRGDFFAIAYSVEAGCHDTVKAVATISAPDAVLFESDTIQTSCLGAHDGEIAIIAHRGEWNKEYLIADGDAAAGTYTKGYPDQFSYRWSMTGSDDSVFASLDFPLELFWKDNYGDTLYTGVTGISGLAAGMYHCTVTDKAGCVFSDSVPVLNPKHGNLHFLEFAYDSATATCHADKRIATIKVNGGWGGYIFSILSDEEMKDTIGRGSDATDDYDVSRTEYNASDSSTTYYSSILEPGHYNVIVFDSLGCRADRDTSFTVAEKIHMNVTADSLRCPVIATGAIHIAATNGDGSYSYQLKQDSVTFKAQTDSVFKSLRSGTYAVFATDSVGCSSYRKTKVIDNKKPFKSVIKEIEPIKCAEDTAGGVLKLNVAGGTSPYEFFRVKGGNTITADYKETDQTATSKQMQVEGLSKTDTLMLVSDAKGCLDTLTFSIPSPDSLRIGNVKATATCDSLGRVIVTNVTGGTQPYMYSLDDSGNGTSNSHLPAKAGNHTATVTDAKGCEVKTDTVTVEDRRNGQKVRTDFLASTYRYSSDVLAIIDLTEPAPDSFKVVFANADAAKYISQYDARLFTYGKVSRDSGLAITNGGVTDADLDSTAADSTINHYARLVAAYRATGDTTSEEARLAIDKYKMLRSIDNTLRKYQAIYPDSIIRRMAFIYLGDRYFSDSVDVKKKGLMDSTGVAITAYIGDCDYTTEYRNLHVLADSVTFYQDIAKTQREILDLSISPNPVEPQSTNYQISVTLSKPMKFTLTLVDVKGETIGSFKFDNGSDSIVTINGNELKALTETSIVVVNTANDKASAKILVK